MDMAADLRSNMAAQQASVADVATLVGRTPAMVTRYRMGTSPIPLSVARVLNRAGLLSDAAILGKGEAA